VGTKAATAAIAKAASTVSINQVTPVIRSTPTAPAATSYLFRNSRAHPAATAEITAPTASMAVVSERLTPPGNVKVCMTNISNTPRAMAPPTGANHSSSARSENRVPTGNKLTSHTANKPGTASPALTPHRGLALTVTGHAKEKITT